MAEAKKQTPSPDELAAEVRAIEGKRLTLGKLLQLVPGGSLYDLVGNLKKTTVGPHEEGSLASRLATTVSQVEESIGTHGLDTAQIERLQADRGSPDYHVSKEADSALSQLLTHTVYLDLRNLGHPLEHLTDNVPGSIAS